MLGTDPHRSSALGLVLALLAFCCLHMTMAWAAPGDARPLVTGITGLDDYSAAAFLHVRSSGARFVRISVEWATIAPRTEPGDWHPADPADPSYDWSETDRAVIGAVETGLTPVLTIEGAPSWAQGCEAPPPVAGRLCDPDPTALATFATAAASRYSGTFQGLPRVRYWQGLNEPNLSLYLNPQFDESGRPISPAMYRRLINAFYAAVKGVDGSNVVLAAGLGPVSHPPWTIGPMRFARLLLCMVGRRDPHPAPGDCEGGVHFDIFDVHPYTTGGPTHKGGADDVELGDLDKLRRLLRAADRAGRIRGRFRHTPLWVTEFSWDSKPPDPGGLPMAIAARWTAEALYRAWGDGVTHFFWYSLRDSARDPSHSFAETVQSGLYFRGPTVAEDRPKELRRAFLFPFVAYSSGGSLRFWGRTPSSTGGKVSIQLRRRGHWLTASTVRAGADGVFTGAMDIAYGRDEEGSVRALYRRETAIPFSLHPVGDFYQPPFG